MRRPTSRAERSGRRDECGRVLAAALVALALLIVVTPSASAEGAKPKKPKPLIGVYVAEALDAHVDVFANVGDTTPTQSFANPTKTDGKLVFLVDQVRTDGWMKVLLPIRPNGSTGWIQSSAVAISYDPYKIVVDLGAHELTVIKRRKVVERDPVGIGKANTPTPGGRYYITQLFAPPNPKGAYGPYAYSLSGFSEVLTTFQGGDAIVGIHGTNHPELIGQDVSSGCIRMRNDAITRLSKILPLGTPVEIKK